jgi:hypothetical protein
MADYDSNRNLDAAGRANRDLKHGDAIHHDDHPSVGDHVGEAAGGISGVLAGAAIGSMGGPIGTIIGGIAGAVGGWWSGRAISEAASRITDEDDGYYRSQYESSSSRSSGRSYDDVRPAYQLGHVAAQNPDYAGRDFESVESDLRRGWTGEIGTKHGDWQSVRTYARDAYLRGRDSARGAANATENAWDRTKAGAEHLGERVSGAAHHAKDSVERKVDRAVTSNADAARADSSADDDRLVSEGPADVPTVAERIDRGEHIPSAAEGKADGLNLPDHASSAVHRFRARNADVGGTTGGGDLMSNPDMTP